MLPTMGVTPKDDWRNLLVRHPMGRQMSPSPDAKLMIPVIPAASFPKLLACRSLQI